MSVKIGPVYIKTILFIYLFSYKKIYFETSMSEPQALISLMSSDMYLYVYDIYIRRAVFFMHRYIMMYSLKQVLLLVCFRLSDSSSSFFFDSILLLYSKSIFGCCLNLCCNIHD